MKVLKLESAEITDQDFILIADAILHTSKCKLVELNLAKNLISDSSASKLVDLLHDNRSLKVLNLHWNQIKVKGGL